MPFLLWTAYLNSITENLKYVLVFLSLGPQIGFSTCSRLYDLITIYEMSAADSYD